MVRQALEYAYTRLSPLRLPEDFDEYQHECNACKQFTYASSTSTLCE